MLEPHFGEHVKTYPILDSVRETIAAITEGGEVTDSISRRLLLRRAYHEAYGISPETEKGIRGPFADVELHPKEDTWKDGPVESALWRYRYYGVGDRFHISPAEFFKYPHHITQMILMMCHDEIQKEAPDLEAARKEMSKSKGM